MEAEKSLERLRQGAEQYEARGAYAGDVSEQVRMRTAAGQRPFATIVTCSDSRVIPEAIFSCGIGDIFVIRTAGSVIGAHELASIEYAAHHLHVPLTVVLGHTHCGAVGAAIAGKTEGNIGVITRAIRAAIGGETDPIKATRINAENSVRCIREDLQGGEAHRVCGAVYDIASGHVTWLEES
jgi:carbonic anhydrase